MKFLDWLFGSDKKDSTKSIVHSYTEDSDGVETNIKIYSDNSLVITQNMGEPFKTYFRLSEEIDKSKDIHAKIVACEESYKILPEFVRAWMKDSTKLPDTILCRDVGVKLYLRLGQWKKAQIAVKKCIAARAYPDNSGEDELKYVKRYKHAVEIAINFLRKNDGFLQKNLYKALSGTTADIDCLKAFTRSSYLITKIRKGNTNQLFINEEIFSQVI